MKRPIHNFILLGVLLLGTAQSALCQHYFKWLDQPAKSFHKKIAGFPNGDIVIADTPVDGNGASAPARGVMVTRLDACGNVLWANQYDWKGNYMEFKDLAVTDKGEILVFGSSYELFEEFIFILKLDKKGNILRFRQYQGGTVDHFTYSIDARDGLVMACGLLLGWTTQKEGFVAVFDENLNYKWGKKFDPFESTGEAIITADLGFLCRSGAYVYKLDAQGAPQWSSTLESSLGFYPVAGPVEVPGGYVFEYYDDQRAFFYKLDTGGKLLWKTRKFASGNQPADLELQADGNLLATYNFPQNGQNIPGHLLLNPDGQIIRQQRLLMGEDLRTGLVDQYTGPAGQVAIVGNADEFSNVPARGFLLQYEPARPDSACYYWDALQNDYDNDISLAFQPLSINISDLEVSTEEAVAKVRPLPYLYTDYCETPPTDTIRTDTLLSCGTDWQLSLPGSEFSWDDGYAGKTRLVHNPGAYYASNHNCRKPITRAYILQKSACNCVIYVPNVFSPNDDGRNEHLELSTNCTPVVFETRIFDRWGDLVFTSNEADHYWDGFIRQRPAPMGVYMVQIRFEMTDENGVSQKGNVSADVLLMR